MFNASKIISDIIKYIREWEECNYKGCNVVIGMSGGKDSTIIAKLLVDALGANRVIGVALPQGDQSINEADKICEWLGIEYMCVNIGNACDAVETSVHKEMELTHRTVQNIPPRIRMTTLYAIAQSCNGVVVNTNNYSEAYIGYGTIYGDCATGAFSPLGNITVTEIYQIGDSLGIPSKWVHKTPDDGLPHSTSDEEKFGFTYKELDDYIRDGIEPKGFCHDNPKEELKIFKIVRLHNENLFKTKFVDTFEPKINKYYE